MSESKDLVISAKAADEVAVVVQEETSKLVMNRPKLYSIPLPPKPMQKVLDEDDYVEAVSNIIKRDFFPLLPRNDAETSKFSLDKFQARFNSEDNFAFNEIVANHNYAVDCDYHFKYGQDKSQLVLEGPNVDKEGNQGPRNVLNFVSNKTGQVEYSRYQARNELMNFPEGAIMTYHDLIETKALPKEIKYDNTRFAIPASLTEEQLLRQRTQQLYNGMVTPSIQSQQVRGYGFVSATPSPVPGIDIDASELMTWGSIDSTPLLIREDGPKFSMPPTPKREVLSHKLSEKASKSIRKRTGIERGLPQKGGWETPGASPQQSPANARLISPAASKLMNRLGVGAISSLRSSYAASPSGGLKRIASSPIVQTPNIIAKRSFVGKKMDAELSMDGLLNLK